MPYTLDPNNTKLGAPSFHQLYRPAQNSLTGLPELTARGNKPLQMEFEDQLKALIFFHLEEHHSGRHLLQVLEQDDYAREKIAPTKGIKKSGFFEAINSRGLEQLIYVYEHLQGQASSILPKDHDELGDLMIIDGSLIDAVFSMYWADYRKGAKKARVHLGFDLNRSIPSKFFLTDGKKDERPFANRILSPGQTGVMDRGYQCHKNFDLWQSENKYFVCRIQDKSHKTIVSTNEVKPDSIVFYDKTVLLGIAGKNLTEKPVRLVGYKIDGKKYWIATNRFDLSAEQIAIVYKLRWEIEKFFGWWKRHLKVYHLLARSEYGLMVQILGGLITYLLLAIYCHEQYNEKVSIKRVRELQTKIRNESRILANEPLYPRNVKEHQDYHIYART